MAVGLLLLGCAISLLVLRLLMLFGLLKVNLNHASEVSPYFWRFCKLNDFVRPCSTHIIIRHRRDFIKPIGFTAGLLLLCGDIATQPGPHSLPGLKNIPYCSTLKCLYMNSRSIGKKLNELQALLIGNDLVFCVESWLNPNYLNCELLPSSADFTIYRRDRENRRGGGVFLAVKKSITEHSPPRSRNGCWNIGLWTSTWFQEENSSCCLLQTTRHGLGISQAAQENLVTGLKSKIRSDPSNTGF